MKIPFGVIQRLLVVSLVAAALCACAGPAKEAKLRALWPMPPETPRVEWLGTYASADDFPKTEAQIAFEKIAGKPPVDRMRSTWGVASDGKGQVYIADNIGRVVYVYDLNKYTVETFTKEPFFGLPAGITVDGAGNIYVCDLVQKVVYMFNPARQLLQTFGRGDDLLTPTYVAVDEGRDRVYVSDSRGNKIFVYNRAGQLQQTIGPQVPEAEPAAAPAAEPKYIFNPQGLAVAKDGNIYVAMQTLAQIAVLTPEGKLVRTFGERGDKMHQFEAPKTVAFDSEGNLWVGDSRRHTLYTFSPEGKLLLITGWKDLTGRSPLALMSPVALFIDGNDRIYVSDRIFQRFSVWQYLSSRYLAEHPISAEELKRVEALAKEAEEKAQRK